MRMAVSKNFYRDEFACRCGCGFDTVDATLVQGLQRLRDILKAPIHVNSGCRCKKHNTGQGGSPKSQHLTGKAADIRVDGKHPEEVAAIAAMLSEFANSGIGIYDTFTHLDARNGKSRWDLRTR